MSNISSQTVFDSRWSGARRSLCLVLLLLLASAQIALPLMESAVAGLTTAVVVCLTVTTVVIAWSTWSPERLGLTFVLVVGAAVVVEAAGSATGWPFGEYEYSDRLQPQVLGVPGIVALAWFAMGLPALELSRRLVSDLSQSPLLRWFLAGVLLTAWDLFLDPQMVAEGFWTWAHPSGWHGIPWSNYVGWLVVGTGIAAVADTVGGGRPINNGLILLYGWMALMETTGFLLPFVFDRPLIGVVGGLAMGVPFLAGLVLMKRDGAAWPQLRS